MIKKILIACTLALAALVPATLTVTPASAGYFTEITHAEDDSGFSAPIYIACKDGRIASLLRGQWSGAFCGAHTDYIYVSPGSNLRCQNLYPPFGWRTYYSTGWHWVDGTTFLKCYVQLD